MKCETRYIILLCVVDLWRKFLNIGHSRKLLYEEDRKHNPYSFCAILLLLLSFLKPYNSIYIFDLPIAYLLYSIYARAASRSVKHFQFTGLEQHRVECDKFHFCLNYSFQCTAKRKPQPLDNNSK